MNKGKFIVFPNFSVDKQEFPWHAKPDLFNSRDKELRDAGGLQIFMKRFCVSDKALAAATLRITSLGIFEAMLNGKRIGRDGVYDELCPLWTDYRSRVFELEYDLLPYMKKKGENVFTARVSNGWWSGRISFGFYGFKSPALCAEIEQAIADMKSDGTLNRLSSDWIYGLTKGTEPEAVTFDAFDGSETIRVAVTGDLPPMDYISADGTPAGFNTALLAEMGARLGKNIELVSVDAGARASLTSYSGLALLRRREMKRTSWLEWTSLKARS